MKLLGYWMVICGALLMLYSSGDDRGRGREVPEPLPIDGDSLPLTPKFEPEMDPSKVVAG